MTATPPFDPPYKCRIVDSGAERWIEVLADGAQVECAAPVLVVPPPGDAARAAPRPSAKAVTLLTVPYAEKDEAKQLGARWDPKRKKWYIPAGVDAAPFSRWVEE
jgi:hypothetical protein